MLVERWYLPSKGRTVVSSTKSTPISLGVLQWDGSMGMLLDWCSPLKENVSFFLRAAGDGHTQKSGRDGLGSKYQLDRMHAITIGCESAPSHLPNAVLR